MLHIKNISFSYDTTAVLDHLDFTINSGEHLSIIGESGSGKSTLLKLMYGEYDLDQGQIFWKDTEILGPKFNLVVGYDFMKYVSQEFDLMPFISVEENIGKHLSNFFPEEKKDRVRELLKVVELDAFAKIKVKKLSGGQKQRVALARALAKQPEILLLDEPFSHIDNNQKQALRRNVFNYLKEKNITCVVATHDSEDVLGYSDRMIVLDNSKIIANDTPHALYRHPQLPLIASFFGEFNMLHDEIVFAHQIKVVENSSLKAVVGKSYFKGPYYLVEAKFENQILRFEHPSELNKNTEIFLEIFKRR